MILEPPCAPVIIKGLSFLRTIVGVIELKGRLFGSIWLAWLPNNSK